MLALFLGVLTGVPAILLGQRILAAVVREPERWLPSRKAEIAVVLGWGSVFGTTAIVAMIASDGWRTGAVGGGLALVGLLALAIGTNEKIPRPLAQISRVLRRTPFAVGLSLGGVLVGSIAGPALRTRLAQMAAQPRSNAGAVADAGPTAAPERQMNSALNDSLARQVREVLHPTGNGGTSANAHVTCTRTECIATWDIAWSGGMTNSPYTSEIVWTVDSSLASKAQVTKETSVIRADAKHIAQMNSLLQSTARDFRSSVESSGEAGVAVGEGACAAAPFDAGRLARLVKNPLAEKAEPHADRGRHAGEHPTYDYAFPDCGGLMLVTYRGKAKAWTLTCYESCLSPLASKLGTLEFLAQSEFPDGSGRPVRARWFLITDGPLGGNIAAFTATGDAPTSWEIDIDSPAAIQEDHTNFIFDWICTHRSGLAGFDLKRCGEP